MSTPAKYSIDRHPPTWQEKMKTEDTKGERKLRRILESLQVPFHSQDQGDFTVGSIVYEVDGAFKDGNQTILDHQAWKAEELRKLGYRVIRLREDEVLTYPDIIAMIVESFWTMEKELLKK